MELKLNKFKNFFSIPEKILNSLKNSNHDWKGYNMIYNSTHYNDNLWYLILR